jgi:hypothetical protein
MGPMRKLEAIYFLKHVKESILKVLVNIWGQKGMPAFLARKERRGSAMWTQSTWWEYDIAHAK